MKAIRIIPFITTIIIMIIIFDFSAQTGIESSHLSRGLTARLIDWLPILKNLTPEEKKNIVLILNRFIRKCAHFTIYAMLGFSTCAMFFSSGLSKRRLYVWIFAWCFSCIYACTDEFHQFFVSGRGGKIKDVIIDTAGAMTGSGAFIFIRCLLFKIKNKYAS